MRKNIFLIGRRRRDENQLTEMLAYLFQREPSLIDAWVREIELSSIPAEWEITTQRGIESGFLDLVLEVPGHAKVIVESKLESKTDDLQINKYLQHLQHLSLPSPAPLKALIFMTQKPESLPDGVELEKAKDVRLLVRRWQLLGDVLRRSDVDLAEDFATMLAEEGMVTPDAVDGADFENWNTGVRVGRRLGTILEEATKEISTQEQRLEKVGAVVYSGNGLIYRLFHFQGLSLGVGFWPVRDIAKAGDLALVNGYVLNTTIPASERKQAGLATVVRAATANVVMSGWAEQYVVRSRAVSEVLTEPEFAGQINQIVGFARETVSFFRELGYLDSPSVDSSARNLPVS